MDEKGWVSIERPQQTSSQQMVDESDRSWPVFSKKFGEERILVRFPSEPEYAYPRKDLGDVETMQIEGKTAYGMHRMLVEPSTLGLDSVLKQKKLLIASEEDGLLVFTEQTDPKFADLLYRNDKKWVRERIFASGDHVYSLQTISESLNEGPHLQFIQSFDLEIRGGNKVFHREIQSEN